MIVGLLSIFAAYGLAIAVVHLVSFRFRQNRRKPIYYVLITRNNGMHIEWYLRSLLFVSRLKAKAIHIAVIDERSEDETAAIVQRLAANRPEEVELIEWSEASSTESLIERLEQEEVVLVRLSNTTEMQSIPLFQ